MVFDLRMCQRIKRAVLQGRAAHAYIFSGPDLSVQTEAVLWFARLLNCESLEEGEPCGRCPGCEKISRNTHPDVRFWGPQGAARSIPVEHMRELQSEAVLRPFEGRSKVHILKEADRMQPVAANALLKILEEPPQSTFIVLLTTRPESLLSTIQSRCQEVAFRRDSGSFSRQELGEFTGNDMQFEILREYSGSLSSAREMIRDGRWERFEAMLNAISGALAGSRMEMYGHIGRLVKRADDDLKVFQDEVDAGSWDAAGGLRQDEDERKAMLAGERMRWGEECLRMALSWVRFQARRKGACGALPAAVDAVHEARRFLERSAPLPMVLELMFIRMRRNEHAHASTA